MVEFVHKSSFMLYEQSLALMENHVTNLINKTSPEAVYLIEYDHVYTAGVSAKKDEILNPGAIPVIYTNRGGKCTYHGPGQRVVYPILDLGAAHRQKDIKHYVKLLEMWIINTLLYFDIKAFAIPGMVGIWVNLKDSTAKIASIGVRLRKWVTYHGFAVNIFPNLSMFSGIIPCGVQDISITSLKSLNVNIALSEFDSVLEAEFSKIFPPSNFR